MSRTAFLASLTVGSLVHLVVSDDCRADAVVFRVTARGFVVVVDGAPVKLDAYGYRGASLVCRIEPACRPAAEWNEMHALLADENRAALLARLAA